MMYQKSLDPCILKKEKQNKTVLSELMKKSEFLRILEKVERVLDLILSPSFGKRSCFIFSNLYFKLKPSHFPQKVKCNLDIFFFL